MVNIKVLMILVVMSTSTGLGQKPEVALQTGHNSMVEFMTFHPDGKLFATATDDMILLWNLEAGKQAFPFTVDKGGITSIFFTGERNLLGCTNNDGKVIYWNVNTGVEGTRINL